MGSAGLLLARWVGSARLALKLRFTGGGRDALRTAGGTPALPESKSKAAGEGARPTRYLLITL